MSSASDSWIVRNRRSGGASGGTSIVPPSIAVIRDPATRTTPNPVFASPGSMPITILIGE